MIQDTELRRGNLITVSGAIHIVEIIYENSVATDKSGIVLLKYADGIQLTPEILQAAGFNRRKLDRQGYYELYVPNQQDRVKLMYCDGKLSLGILGVAQFEWFPYLPCQYVHQLQNLFYIITGQELPITIK